VPSRIRAVRNETRPSYDCISFVWMLSPEAVKLVAPGEK
jgi:hypothetical protein